MNQGAELSEETFLQNTCCARIVSRESASCIKTAASKAVSSSVWQLAMEQARPEINVTSSQEFIGSPLDIGYAETLKFAEKIFQQSSDGKLALAREKNFMYNIIS